ncbi:MAG: flagellar motor protein MotB [Oscillibacter sp.]|nr:flagellar motor protein MotB [Oscillibacter sp.]
MAVKKKSGGGGGGANWMDTYGDMVTLLLCFFVLLYSMSTISEEKFKAIVQSFNPSSLEATTMTSGSEGPLADPSEGIGSDYGLVEPDPSEEVMEQADIDALMEQLAQMLKEMAQQSSQSENIEVTKGDGYVFVSFNDAVFFLGDSPAITAEGEQILNVVAEALNQAAPAIDELRIMGHTAQASPDRPNNVDNDRRLASNRATNVTIYLQKRATELSPARMVSVGYGQWRPVDTNATRGGRAHNRRVEMIITGKDLYDELGDALQQYRTIRTGDAPEEYAEEYAE